MRYSLIVAMSVGAFFGATIGAMYDDVLEPGRITLIGAGIGAVAGLIGLFRLHRCVPGASYWG